MMTRWRKVLESWKKGFKTGARRKASRKAERDFAKPWKKVKSLHTFEAHLLGEVDGLRDRLDVIDKLAGY